MWIPGLNRLVIIFLSVSCLLCRRHHSVPIPNPFRFFHVNETLILSESPLLSHVSPGWILIGLSQSSFLISNWFASNHVTQFWPKRCEGSSARELGGAGFLATFWNNGSSAWCHGQLQYLILWMPSFDQEICHFGDKANPLKTEQTEENTLGSCQYSAAKFSTSRHS